jgi:c-di-GMP-binding flagellar brake protein YcgR
VDIKRENKRKNLKVYLKTLDDRTNQVFGFIVDITKEGIMVTREQGVDVDEVLQLRMVLPTEIDGKREFSFSAKSRWSKKDSDSEFYNIGLQFIKPSPGDIRIIDNLIQNFCFDTDTE